MNTRLAFCLTAALLFGCSAKKNLSRSLSESSQVAYLEKLENKSSYLSLVKVVDDLSFVKFSYNYGAEGSPIYFQNTGKYEFHFPFLKSSVPRFQHLSPTAYNDLIFASPAKEISAGAIYHSDALDVPGFNQPGVLAFTMYFKGQLDIDEVKALFEKIKGTVTFAEAQVAFAIENMRDYRRYKRRLVQAGIPVVKLAALIGRGDSSKTYHSAKSYGYLKQLSIEELESGDYNSKDILVLKSVPLDIGPVSGIITDLPQPPHSHIIFRAIDQNIPNLYVPNASSNPVINKYYGQLVELSTHDNGIYTIKGKDEIGERIINDLADEYFAKRIPALPPLEYDLSIKKLLNWRSQIVSREFAKTYGTKGTNFAILDNALDSSGYGRNQFRGSFLIPFSYYVDHVDQKVSPNLCSKSYKKCRKSFDENLCTIPRGRCDQFANDRQSIRSYLEKLSSPTIEQSLLAESRLRKAELTFARGLIEKAPLNSDFEQIIINKIKRSYSGTTRMRFRSSTNAEDLPGLNGAGLYSSESGCIADQNRDSGIGSLCVTNVETQRTRSLIEELTQIGTSRSQQLIERFEQKLKRRYQVRRAVRKVFASLWSEKAFLYRDYLGINHSEVFMGILVHPSYVDEKANGVAIVEKGDDGSYKLNIAVQKDDISVTNPEIPETIPDQYSFTYRNGQIEGIQFTLHSNRIEPNQTVLDVEHNKSLAKQLVVTHESLRSIYGEETIKRLDSEFILSDENKIVIKQARPL